MNILVQHSDMAEFRRRYRWIVFGMLLAFLSLGGRLVELQLVEGDVHRAQARRNIVGEVKLATTRGVIRDAFGRVLAANRPSYNVYVVPNVIDLEETWPRVVKLMGLDAGTAGELERHIAELRAKPGNRGDQQTLLAIDVDRDVVAALQTHESDLLGLYVTPVPVRYYPFGSLGAHLVGYMREIDPETLARLEGQDYRAGDRMGAVGVERRWESYLRGQRGWKKVVRWKSSLRGKRTKQDVEAMEALYLEEPRRVEPVPGRDISLTVDVELQQAIDKAMRGQLAGAVVVVDVRTGRLLAALAKPSLDPNVISGAKGADAIGKEFKRLYKDPLHPTLDKTISAAYPPGSTYKPFSALAGLADTLISPSTEVDCRGGYEFGKRYFRCTGVHRKVRLHDAIVRSCNTYFYALGEAIHIDRLAQIGIDFGFGAKTGIGVNPEARGRMPTRAWYTRRQRGSFRGGFTLLAAIGQGATTATVLQLALAYAAIANNGTLYRPQVVRSIETSDGTIVQEFPPRVKRILSVNQQHLQMVKAALADVVTERTGTAYAQRDPEVDMAGKTGTAQVSHVTPKGVDPEKVWYFNRDHAWFAGYAPSRAPEIAIVVLVEHGGGGGANAVPVAMRVVRAWQDLSRRRRAEPHPEREQAGAGEP